MRHCNKNPGWPASSFSQWPLFPPILFIFGAGKLVQIHMAVKKGNTIFESGMLFFVGTAILATIVTLLFVLIHQVYSGNANQEIITIPGYPAGLALLQGRKKASIPQNMLLHIAVIIGTALVLFMLWGVVDENGQKVFTETLFRITG